MLIMVQQSDAQILGREAETWFRSVLPREWIAEQPKEDIGLDFIVFIGDKTEVGKLEFGVQVKGSANRPIVRDDIVSEAGITRGNVIFWASRLAPTLLVLYDDSKKQGYYGWIPKILPSAELREFLASKRATITLKVPIGNRIEERAWKSIREAVTRQRDSISGAVFTINVTRALLEAINLVASSLRLLLIVQFDEPTSRTQEHQMLLDLADTLSHAELIKALHNLSEKLEKNTPMSNFVMNAVLAYQKEVEVFTSGFEKVLEGKDAAVLINPDLRKMARPRLVIMQLELIHALSQVKVVTGTE